MNLQKYTKSELIKKFQILEKTKQTDNKPQSKFIKTYLDIKQYIITLFLSGAISIIFKKYKILGRIFRFFNWIIMGIFGISLIDSFNALTYVAEIKKVFTSIISYIISTSIYQYFLAINPFQYKEPYSWQKETIKPRWKSSEVHPKNSWNETDIGRNNSNSKIAEWLELKEKAKEHRDNHREYYLLGLLLLLGGACWYYWSDDNSPPGISSIISGAKYAKDKIEEILGWKRTYHVAASNLEDVRQYLRNPENRTFERESNAIVRDIVDARVEADRLKHLPEPIIGNPLDEYNKFLIVKTRLQQLKDKFPQEYQNWMDTNIQANRLVNRVLSNETKLLQDLTNYPNLENETLIQQRAWSDPSSPMSQGMGELSIDMVNNSTIQRSDSETTIVPSAPPAPDAPPLPPVTEAPSITEIPEIPKTHKGIFEGGLENLRGKLKKATTVVKDKTPTGKILGETEDIEPVASSSNIKLEDDSLTGKLSSGLNKMRSAIMPDDDENLTQNYWDDDSPSSNLIDKGKGKEILTHIDKTNNDSDKLISLSKLTENNDKEKIDIIIKKTLHLDSDDVIKEIKKSYPNYDENSYRADFLKAMEQEIDSGKTQEEKDKIKKEIMKADLLEIQSTGGTSDPKAIRNVLRENYTHNKLLNEIKKNLQKMIFPL